MSATTVIPPQRALIFDKRTCRLCCSLSDHGNLLFSQTGMSKNLVDNIRKYCQIDVTYDDGMPQRICRSCENKLRATVDFVELCCVADQKLREQYAEFMQRMGPDLSPTKIYNMPKLVVTPPVGKLGGPMDAMTMSTVEALGRDMAAKTILGGHGLSLLKFSGVGNGDKPADLVSSSFAEVVTMYKCKFCKFSSSWASGVASHVQSIHKDKVSYSDKRTLTQLSTREGRNNLEVSKVYKLNEINMDDMPTYSSRTADEETAVVGENEEDIAMHVGKLHVDQENQAIPELHSKLSQELVAESHLKEEGGSDEDDEREDTGKENDDGMEDVDEEEDEDDEEEEEEEQDGDPIGVMSASQSAEEEFISRVDCGDGVSSNRLYLCNQCNTGFPNRELYKNHMLAEHQVEINMQNIEPLKPKTKKKKVPTATLR